jgi:hypothetical protein
MTWDEWAVDLQEAKLEQDALGMATDYGKPMTTARYRTALVGFYATAPSWQGAQDRKDWDGTCT